jgi:MFS family permease
MPNPAVFTSPGIPTMISCFPMTTNSTTRQALRISNIEGSWATLHFVLTSGAFFTGFALMLGANDFQLGLLSAMPLLAQVFQLPGAWLVEKTGHRRVLVGWFSVISRTFWLPIALIPALFADHPMRMFIALCLASSIAMNLASSGWVAWMSALVPPSIRGRYFATRGRITGVVAIVASLGGGLAIDLFKHYDREYAGYLVLMMIAVGAGLMAFRLILRQPDPDYRAEALPALTTYLAQPMRDANYRRIIAFYLYWLFAVNLASPFFNAHLLKHMGWNFRSMALLGVVSSVTTILLQSSWGRAVDRYGHKPVLMITAIGIIHLPFYYAFCPWDRQWPIYLNAMFGGVFWAGFGLASFNQLIDVLPARRRTMYVAVLSALSGVTNFFAATFSGWLADLFEGVRWQFGSLTVVNYQILFIITGLVRIPGLLLLRRIREPDAEGTGVVIRKVFDGFYRRLILHRPMFPVPVKDGGTEFPKPD